MTPADPSDLNALLGRLKAEQHELLDGAASDGGLPPTSALRRIADLENTIAAVIALVEERGGETGR